jgi:hypothetical protein
VIDAVRMCGFARRRVGKGLGLKTANVVGVEWVRKKN